MDIGVRQLHSTVVLWYFIENVQFSNTKPEIIQPQIKPKSYNLNEEDLNTISENSVQYNVNSSTTHLRQNIVKFMNNINFNVDLPEARVLKKGKMDPQNI